MKQGGTVRTIHAVRILKSGPNITRGPNSASLYYTVSPVRWDTYFQANRVEHQKLNQTTADLSFG